MLEKNNIIDDVDIKIIECLRINSRMQVKDIAEFVHLSAPAVANRISKMKEHGIIKGFTVKIDESKFNNSMQCFIIVFMKNTNHYDFQKMIRNKDAVIEGHKISGNGCYMLKVSVKNQIDLNELLSEISLYGTYQLNISIDKFK